MSATISLDEVETTGRRGPVTRAREVLGRRAGFARDLLIFGILVVLGVTAGLVYVLQEDLIFPWEHVTDYYANFSDASAIAPGQHQEVRVAGVHVGDIGSASVATGGVAHVQLEITNTGLKIYQNATALLQAKTPLNEMYVELNPGTPAAPPLKHGGTIPLAQTQSPVEIDQILQNLGPEQQTAIQVLLEQTNVALSGASGYLPSDLASLDGTLGGLQPVATALATREAKIRTLVTDLTQISGAVGGNQARLASLITGAQKTLTTLEANDGSLSQSLKDLPGTTQALGGSLSKVQALTGQLNPLLDNLRASAQVLPKALNTLTATVNNLHPVVNDLGPVVTAATPVVADLRQYLDSVNPTLTDFKTIAPDLSPLTSYLEYDMPWLKGFFYNTDSTFSSYVNTPGDTAPTPVVRSLIVAGSPSLEGALCQTLGISLPANFSGVGKAGC